MQNDTRMFHTGATRDVDTTKLDYEGFLSPVVLRKYAEYMHRARSRNVPDGLVLRESDNWQKGMPRDVYMKSLLRHVLDVWILHRKPSKTEEDFAAREDALCAVLFNAMGYLFEDLNGQ